MAPRSRRSIRAREAVQHRWEDRKTPISPRRMAYAILVEGGRPEQTFRIFERCGFRIPPRHEIYREMTLVGNEICAMARESMRLQREQLRPGTVISFDGSWDHRRNGSNCLFTVMECQKWRIIESVVISKRAPPTSQKFCETSTQMEAKGLIVALQSLAQCPGIVGYVHDNDARARKIMEQSGLKIFERLDPGHCLKSFDRKIQNFNRKNGQVLRGIEGSLRRWISTLLKSDLPTEQKVFQWKNALEHYCGHHEHCLHGDCATTTWDLAGDMAAREALKKFLTASQYIVENCERRFSTVRLESFHRLKVKYAPKDVHWGKSWEARMMCAVLDVNKPRWKDELLERIQAEQFTVHQRIDIVVARLLERDPPDPTDEQQIPDLEAERDIYGGELYHDPLPLYRRNPYIGE